MLSDFQSINPGVEANIIIPAKDFRNVTLFETKEEANMSNCIYNAVLGMLYVGSLYGCPIFVDCMGTFGGFRILAKEQAWEILDKHNEHGQGTTEFFR